MLLSITEDRFGNIHATPVSDKQAAKLKKAMRESGLSTKGAPIFAQDGTDRAAFWEHIPARKHADIGKYRVYIRMSDEVVYNLAGVAF